MAVIDTRLLTGGHTMAPDALVTRGAAFTSLRAIILSRASEAPDRSVE